MLKLKPITLKEANIFVAKHHRHHPEAQGHKFSIGVSDAESLRGVAIAGRPVARNADDGWTAEVYRVCTDGAHNACSMLYGACWRAAKAMGYLRAITYTLPSEGGASLRAAGWVYLGRVKGGSWSRPSRKRDDDHPLGDKDKWGIGDIASMMRSAKPDEQFDDAGSGGELRLCEYRKIRLFLCQNISTQKGII